MGLSHRIKAEGAGLLQLEERGQASSSSHQRALCRPELCFQTGPGADNQRRIHEDDMEEVGREYDRDRKRAVRSDR